MNPIQTYLAHVQQIHGTGQAVKETSYYPAMAELFNELGKTLSPKVFCVINLANKGAGLPDGGFFPAAQHKAAQKNDDEKVKENPLLALLPERGVLEVKGAAQNLDELRDSKQVAKYLEKYGQILITNLREFALVERDANGKLSEVERFSLATSPDAFWKLNPSQYAKFHGEEAVEFLARCLLSGAPLASPQDVAAFLASYARQARLGLEHIDMAQLKPLRDALESVLGVKFEADDSRLPEKEQKARGDRFFRATLVQTLFYGLFSAWLSHVEENADEPFHWKQAQWSLHVPAVSVLFEQLMQKSQLQSLGLQELVELAARVLNRVQTKSFFEKWSSALAVQYFYEPFLEKFDPVLRKELGVYYTPPEIVKYMVERVHRVLQTELKRPAGLADPDVVVLDPCCGTGAYVVEVLRKIAEELKESSGALLAHDLKTVAVGNAAQNKEPRVFGFEILPAPFVVAHHGVARVLSEYGAHLNDNERAAIYLTNALTGWTEEPKTKVLFSELEKEREASQKVKRNSKILVILGNPPYDAFAKITEEPDLVKPYKDKLQSEWGIKKFNLDDLYIRFFRVAERRLTQNSEGVLCFISNFSYLREPSFVVMRQKLLDGFDAMWIDVMNGDSRETGKRTPDGDADPSVFSTSFNPAGIRVGTAINLMVRTKERGDKTIRSRNFWGTAKREELLDSLQQSTGEFDRTYEQAAPKKENRYSLRPSEVSDEYRSWTPITELAEILPSLGLLENRKEALISIERESLEKRMCAYYDSEISWEDIEKLGTGLTKVAARFDPIQTRSKVLAKEKYNKTAIRRFFLRPFDLRWCFYTAVRPLWNEPRPALAFQNWDGNSFFVSRKNQAAKPEGAPVYFTSSLGFQHALHTDAYFFPIFLRKEIAEDLEPDENGVMQIKHRLETRANLSEAARKYLQELGLPSPDDDEETAALLWHHALAMGYASAYRAEHADGLASDWPRVPLPREAGVLKASAALGAQVAALLDVSQPLAGVTQPKLRAGLATIGALARIDGGAVNPDYGDLKISASWGHFGGRGEVMAGGGKVMERAPSTQERAALDAMNLAHETTVCDVYLNDAVYWSCIPRGAWQTVIGGYQVMKKWLSYRDFKVLGRDLTTDEAREVEQMARRLAVLQSLESALDENYQNCK